ncbi:peptidase S8/S53 domain-containing protein [Hypoxylon sp. FL1857]|nr:peptidase S8/S53 domain-containing protein [Hypoxylon sp. FL1857]
MTSCVGGAFAGTFKQASIVPIKFMTTGLIAPTLADAVNAIAVALNDKAQSGVPAGVLSMSFGFKVENLRVTAEQPENTVDPFADLLQRTEQANIIPVASSGNYENQDLTDNTPRRNGGANTNMIVVGAADETSSRYSTSTFKDPSGQNILSIYAMGRRVVCAGQDSPNSYKRNTGSSPATAQVAGIVAMYLAKGLTTVPNAKQYLLQEALRLKGGNWPNDGMGAPPGAGPPRAAVGWQIPCQKANAPLATQPPYEPPIDRYYTDTSGAYSKPITNWDANEPDCVRPIP